MRFASTVLVISSLPACATSLEERLDEPDVAIPNDCAAGDSEIELSGTVVDFTTGEPVAGARIDLTEAFTPPPRFPTSGCRIGGTTTDAAGHFQLTVRAFAADPTIAFLVTGAGRAPTISDTSVFCLFGCSREVHDIAAPSRELVDAWRQELYDGGMEYALNRGLVAYKFHDLAGKPAMGVKPVYEHEELWSDPRVLEPGSEVRFLNADRVTLAPPERSTTLASDTALIGGDANLKGYFHVSGERGGDRWYSVGVIVATGWIYFESDTVDPQ